MKKRQRRPTQLDLLTNTVEGLIQRVDKAADVGGVRTIGEEVNKVVNRVNEIERRLDTGQSKSAKAIFSRLDSLERRIVWREQMAIAQGTAPPVSAREQWLEREVKWLRSELDYYTRRAR